MILVNSAAVRCAQCGSNVPGDAKFCPQCGKAVSSTEPSRPATETEPAKGPSLLRKPFAVVLIVLLAGLYAAQVFAIVNGSPFNGVGATFMSVLGWAYLWKLRGRREWVGALVGFGAAIAMAVIAGGVA